MNVEDFRTASPRSTKYYLIQYNDNSFRILKIKYKLESGWEFCLDGHVDYLKQAFKDYIYDILHIEKEEEILRCSLSRTKSRIRELALCNNFEYFGTITINGFLNNRYELEECQNRLKKTLKNIKDYHSKNLKYLIITEKHKDGAFHFHGLFSGLELQTNEFGYLYNLQMSKTLGYNSFSKINDYNKTCNYITKYITKDCVKNNHNQVFLRSKGLCVATKEEIKPIELGNKWKYENDFVAIYDIDLQNINNFDKKILTDLISNEKKC